MTTFVRVVDAGSLSAAARSLHLSPAAVSRQIAALEETLGGPLIVRSTRKQTITAGGRRYYEHCVTVLREVESAQSSIREDSAVSGTLTVTAPVTFGLERVQPYLPAFLAKHPCLQVDLRLEDRVVDLISEGVDVAIRTNVLLPETTAIVAHRLLTYRRIVVASPRYLEDHGEPKTPDDLHRHKLLLHAGAGVPSLIWQFRRGSEQWSLNIPWIFRSNAVYALRDAAIDDVGIAQLPDWLVAKDIERGRLREVLDDFKVGDVTVYAVYRRELRASARVRAFIAHLTASYKA
jgi:DNA-binding transcriptional LysR family regulator